jgi:gas vesicle protein
VRKGTGLHVSLIEQTVSQRLHKLQSSFPSIVDAKSRFNIEQSQKSGGLVDNQREVRATVNSSSSMGKTFGYLVAGLGIGAALSIFLAPRSGAETRQWLANKCLNGIDTANEKVRKTRLQVKDIMDQGQQKISEAIVAGREVVGKS